MSLSPLKKNLLDVSYSARDPNSEHTAGTGHVTVTAWSITLLTTKSRQNSLHTQPSDLSLFVLLDPSNLITRAPSHLDTVALPPLNTLQSDRLRDAMLLIWLQTSRRLRVEVERIALHDISGK